MRVVLAAPLYNHAEHLPAAIDSLLAQSHRDFALILLDDRSTDGTELLAEAYAASDPRVAYVRNERRLGLVGSWRRAYELARERFPGFEYFAWASDHDLWEPDWLRTLLDELDAHPEAVAAYPLSDAISEEGAVYTKPSGRPRTLVELDTAGIRSPWRRMWRAYRGMSAGAMVYGLFRADALARAGVFRFVIGPDRLLLTELALQGEFRQPRQVLWHRRFRLLHTPARQRAGSFPDGAPAYSYLPADVQYLGAVAGPYVLRPAPGSGGRLRGLLFLVLLGAVSLVHAAARILRVLRRLVFRTDRPIDRLRKSWARARKRINRRTRNTRRRANRAARKATGRRAR